MEIELELYDLTDDLILAGQIGPDSIPFLAKQGIRAIVCNRFDHEEPGQPSFGSIEQAAAAHGIITVNQPVLMPPAQLSDEEGAAFGAIIDRLPKPVLAYCRTGSRCAILWALSEARRRPFRDVVLAAMGAGYDLTGFVPRLQKLYRP